MNQLFVYAAHNCLAALVLALVVYGITRIWHNPPAAHVLWLLVLLKLVAPPILYVDWRALVPRKSTMPHTPGAAESLRVAGQSLAHAENPVRVRPVANRPGAHPSPLHARLASRPIAPESKMRGTKTTSARLEQYFAGSLSRIWSWGEPALCSLWIGGGLVCASVAAARILRFERLLRETLPPPARLQRLVENVAERIGVRAPKIAYAECVDVPLVWCVLRRPTLVLPLRLFRQLDDEAAAMIVAHELAHLRRRDHRVRVFEMAVALLYWWNPLVWLVRRQIHDAEDYCCDAWVRWAFPAGAKNYADVVFKAAEFVNGPGLGARLLPASAFFYSLSLKARIQMILDGRFSPRLSRGSCLIVALCALALIPSFLPSSVPAARAGENDSTAAASAPRPAESATLEFPHKVKFELGQTGFAEGDQINILEVRGTAETFTPGNLYWIKGTYTLASRDRASLSALVTANDAKNGRSSGIKMQNAVIQRGQGTFTLVLLMNYPGWPHLSFYPAEGGEGFGGIYFGTGESVMKPQKPAEHRLPAARFKHRVPFEIGLSEAYHGGKVEIREVWGTRPKIEVGGQYLVRGKYTLPPGEEGHLFLSATAGGAWGQTASLDLQFATVEGQSGEFELYHGMAGPGFFHVILSGKAANSRYGDVYFGTGDTVYRK